MQPFETFIPGAKKIEDSPVFNKDIVDEAIKDILSISGNFSKKINRKPEWESFLTETAKAKEDFIIKKSLNEEQKRQINVVFALIKALYNEWSRTKENPNVLRLNIESAAWQQELGNLIFSHRSKPEILNEIKKYWDLLGKLSYKILWDKEFDDKQRKGVERFVASASVLDKLGYSLEAPGGKLDAEVQLDLIGQKEVDERIVAILAQIKPQKQHQEEEIAVEVYSAQSDQQRGGVYISPEVQRLIKFAQKTQPKLKHTILVPVEINIAAPSDYTLENPSTSFAEKGTGLVNKNVLDKLPEEVYSSIRFAESFKLPKKG